MRKVDYPESKVIPLNKDAIVARNAKTWKFKIGLYQNKEPFTDASNNAWRSGFKKTDERAAVS